jgi:hypothetical protein
VIPPPPRRSTRICNDVRAISGSLRNSENHDAACRISRGGAGTVGGAAYGLLGFAVCVVLAGRHESAGGAVRRVWVRSQTLGSLFHAAAHWRRISKIFRDLVGEAVDQQGDVAEVAVDGLRFQADESGWARHPEAGYAWAVVEGDQRPMLFELGRMLFTGTPRAGPFASGSSARISCTLRSPLTQVN